MDLFTGNAAYSLHQQDARRAERELEHRRVANERAAQLDAERKSAGVTVPARPQGVRGLITTLLHGHRATAQ